MSNFDGSIPTTILRTFCKHDFPCTHFLGSERFKPKLFMEKSHPNLAAETGGGCRVDATRSPRAAEAARQPGAVCALVGELPQLGGWDPKKVPWHPDGGVGWLSTKNFGGFHQQLDGLQECWVVYPLVIFVDTSNLMIYKNVAIELGYTGRKLGDVASIYGSEYAYFLLV